MNPTFRGLYFALPAILSIGVRLCSAQVAPPANDDFTNAVEIVTTSEGLQLIELTGNILGATVESGEEENPELAAHNDLGTIWWKWTCPTPGYVEFIAFSTNFSLAAGVFAGTNISNLTTISEPMSDIFLHPEGTFDAGGGFIYADSAGVTYYFPVMLKGEAMPPVGNVQGTFRFTPYIPPPPITNDHFANRTVLVGTNVTVAGRNSDCSTEPGENVGGGGSLLLNSVWYAWTSPTNGVLRVTGTTTVPNFFLSIGVYRGNAVNALVPVSSTPDGGVPVTTGDTLVFQVASLYYTIWGGGGGSGPFTLGLSLEVPTPTSPNDAFANRIAILSASYHFEGSIYGATNEPGEPLPPGTIQTLWWEFTAPESGLINVLVGAGQFQASLAVYEGNQLTALSPRNPVNGARYQVLGGHTYAIQLASGPITSGSFTLDVRFHSQSNDFFAGSEHLEGTNFVYHGNFTVATTEAGEPTPAAPNTVWVSWSAPETGRVWFNLATTYQFQNVALFTGSTLATLQPVSTVPMVNRINSFIAIEGTVYHFQLSGGADDFTLSLLFHPFQLASNDKFADAAVVKGNVLYIHPHSTMGATMELGEPAPLGLAPQKSIWWKWQAPRHGQFYMSSGDSLISSVVLAAYQGNAVEALKPIAKGTNELRMGVTGGETYYFAAVVQEDAVGDVGLYAQVSGFSNESRPVPGNLLQEPSWEGTAILGVQHWKMSGSIGGYVNEGGGCDGTTWPTLGTGAKIWQDFPTIPGHEYHVRFAFYVGSNLSGCCGLAGVRSFWDDRDLGISYIQEDDGGYWHWANFVVVASNTTSRVTFENIHRNLEMDAFSVVDLSAPPTIVTQPTSISSLVGGSAAFIVGVSGSTPLTFQWYHDGAPLAGQTDRILNLSALTASQAGQYHAAVSNAFGFAISTAANLLLDAPTNATILVQPSGDTVPVGGYFNASVVASGTPVLRYQWFLEGVALTDATNRNLTLTNAQPTDAGSYEVRVQNDASTVWSLPIVLNVATNVVGGGMIDFRNRLVSPTSGTNDAPVFDIDGFTRLNSSNYVAQLYGGPSLDTLRPVGLPSQFRNGFNAGFFVSKLLTLPNVAPGETAFAQVRVWDINQGASYEEARALGGKFGRSEILQVVAGPPSNPTRLIGLSSFSLQPGLPAFTVGVIEFVERQPDNILVWAVRGETGFRYLVEKSDQSGSSVWRPHAVLTNAIGTVTFTDSASSDSAFYRARILD